MISIDLRIYPDGPTNYSHICIVVDVLRAFTTTRVLFHHGVEKIRVVPNINEALTLKSDSDSLIIGEKGGIKLPEADIGNSPSLVPKLQRLPNEVILVSSNGAPALLSASHHETVFAAGLRDLHSISNYIESRFNGSKSHITVLASSPGEEDILFHTLLTKIISGSSVSATEIKESVFSSKAAQKFRGGDELNFPFQDLVDSAVLEEDCSFVQQCFTDEVGVYLGRTYV